MNTVAEELDTIEGEYEVLEPGNGNGRGHDISQAQDTGGNGDDFAAGVPENEKTPKQGDYVSNRRSKLSQNQEKFLLVRPNVANDVAAAAKIGLAPGTPQQWKQRHPEFRAAYAELRRAPVDLREEAVRQLREAAPSAILCLVDRMENSKSDNVRVKAAAEILSRCGIAAVAEMNVNVQHKLEAYLTAIRDAGDDNV